MPCDIAIASLAPGAAKEAAWLDWIEPGRCFGFEELVSWQGKGQVAFAEAAARCDTILCGPIATAAFPAELRPFLAPGVTRRRQHAAAATATAALGAAWAAHDPGVIFLRNPHPPLVGEAGQAGTEAAGLLRPASGPAEKAALDGVLLRCVAQGRLAYVTAREKVLAAVLAARPRGRRLHVLSLQQAAMMPMAGDGVLVPPRPWPEASPRLANLCCRAAPREGTPPEGPTMPGGELRLVAAAWAEAFGYPEEVARMALPLDRACPPGCEVLGLGTRLAALREPRVGALRVEFRREWLLGPEALDMLSVPGTDWPEAAPGDLASLLGGLLHAAALLRA